MYSKPYTQSRACVYRNRRSVSIQCPQWGMQWGRTTWTSLLNGGFNLPHLQLRAPFSWPPLALVCSCRFKITELQACTSINQ